MLTNQNREKAIAYLRTTAYNPDLRMRRVIEMFQRILTDLERKAIKSYLKTDGKKESVVRSLVSRGRRHLPTIRSNLELLTAATAIVCVL